MVALSNCGGELLACPEPCIPLIELAVSIGAR